MLEMTRFLLIVSLLAATAVSAEEVYVEVDKDGVPTFSDQALPGGEKVKISPPMTYSDPEAKNRVVKKTEKLSPGGPGNVNYSAFISSPASDSAIRNNEGLLNLEVVIQPSLGQGHSASLIMNGTSIRRIRGSGSVQLSNVDRGTHTFNIRITDGDNVVFEGPTATITMLRHSIRHRAN